MTSIPTDVWMLCKCRLRYVPTTKTNGTIELRVTSGARHWCESCTATDARAIERAQKGKP